MDDSLSWNYVNKEYINDMIHTYEISNPKTRISTTTAKNGDENNNNNMYIKNRKKEFKWAASNSCNGEKKIEAISQITYEANIVRWTVNWQVRRKSHKPNTNGDITVYNIEREGNQKPNTRSAFTRKESNVLSTSSSSSSTWCIPRIRWMLTAKHSTFNAWTSTLFEFYTKH